MSLYRNRYVPIYQPDIQDEIHTHNIIVENQNFNNQLQQIHSNRWIGIIVSVVIVTILLLIIYSMARYYYNNRNNNQYFVPTTTVYNPIFIPTRPRHTFFDRDDKPKIPPKEHTRKWKRHK